ncbi:signal recognition particle SRP19 subunit [Ceratobasidium sp. AG-Ba]|nr:signal recognition particle SRP19 subunit [Ceratobasidium sp. AG-Ba]QRW10919.1 signal recognition particle SRP19 subunit [Ceratobasidium sp. AG-Ba]
MASRQRITLQDASDSDSDGERRVATLPNTGTRGALIQEIGEASDPDEPSLDFGGPAMGASSSAPFRAQHTQYRAPPADLEKYKRWTSLYPIYFDAKRPYGQGQRRLAREKSIWWPQSRDIEVAARILGISTFHEPTKRHPQDWENPGRVKVLWKENGQVLNQKFNSKKRLLEAIAIQIQKHKPEQIPTPETSVPSRAPPKSALAKGQPTQRKSFKVPQAPQPWPKLQDRVSPYSPIVDAGIYVDAVKNSLATEKKNAETGAGAIAGQQQAQANAGKGKKKVIRVRG